MTSLVRELRKDLEKTVKQARRVAEAGARKAVDQLGVGEGDAPKYLTPAQKVLRNRLRAHGRQLGDRRDAKAGTQATSRLVQECAYEHWHRMLFARFLAETDLLIEPASGVAITLDEVQELAREKAKDWLELASDYAERMLPQIFRKGDPVLEIGLPPETRSELEDLLKKLPRNVFEADDSLGWVYQFWQSEKKDEVNKSEAKIGADELPAVTQLFTEDYMVLFLLHNTLGAWWAGKMLAENPSLTTSAESEDELRRACKVGDIDWGYLRFVRDQNEGGTEGPWRPAAGVFDEWPRATKELTVLDPCMGSGHFLVFALPILVAFRIDEEGLGQTAAVDAVLKDNLFGLEIDPRCTQIAAFNLAFAAWRRIGYRSLPQVNLACSGLAIGVSKTEWLKLAEKAVTAADPAAKRDLLGTEQNLLTAGLEARVKNGLEALYDLFAKAPWLGSLIDPRRAGGDIFREGFDKLEPFIGSILSAADTDEAREIVVAAQGMAKAAELLARKYTLISTNVPYLGAKKQDEVMASFCASHYPLAKADLASCFVARLRSGIQEGGTLAIVTPQNWLFLGSYARLRGEFLKHSCWNFVSFLGAGAFESISGEVVNVGLLVISGKEPDFTTMVSGLDVSENNGSINKSDNLSRSTVMKSSQQDFLTTPDHRVAFQQTRGHSLLSSYAISMRGIVSGDRELWVRNFWEFPKIEEGWRALQSTVEVIKNYGGREHVIDWRRKGAGMLRPGTKNEAYGSVGVAITQMGNLPCTIYSGELYDNNTGTVVPKKESDLSALWAFCRSNEFRKEVRKIDRKMNVTNATFLKVPIDIEYWRNEARTQCSSGLPVPETQDATQWIFEGSPPHSTYPLQVAVARLLSYCWPRHTGSSFLRCPALGPDNLEQYGDTDGIVCLTAIKGEIPAAERLNALLSGAFGADWSAAKLASLLAETGYAGKSLDDWLRDGFFSQHCELFHQRPFIWHIWDGRRDGFHALVNYHRIAAPGGEGRRTLEKLIYFYLGDWIDRQRADQKAGVEGADARLAHAEHLKNELIKILKGEPPYDLFVRWKPLHGQPIGWEPDLNDGVRMNIRPFMSARLLNARGAIACILRVTPKIKWDKDRGKEPNRDKADYPWFWGWDETADDFFGTDQYDGNRWNELHYSRAIKEAARARRRAKSGGKS